LEVHGGRIEVTSQLDHESVFSFGLLLATIRAAIHGKPGQVGK